jgi:hypothetical protein
MLVPPPHHALPCPCRYQFSSHGSDYRRICKVNLKAHPCHRSFNGAQVRPMAAPFPKSCYWGLLYTLFWPIREIAGWLLAGWKHSILGCCCMEELMCCQSLGHCYRICGKSKLILVLANLVFAECPRAVVLGGVLASWRLLANTRRTSFSYTFVLPVQELVGRCHTGRLSSVSPGNFTSHHTSDYILHVCLSGVQTLKLERRFSPQSLHNSEGKVMSKRSRR